MQNIFQILYYGLDNNGDKNGEIWEVGYFDDRNRATDAIFQDGIYNNECDLKNITDSFEYAKFELIDRQSREIKGYYEILKLQINKILNNQLAE